MPELPEVETTARGLRPRLVGRQIVTVSGVDWPRMLPNATAADLAAGLPGKRVEAVERRGKYLILRLSDGSALMVHRKMSGNLLLQPAGSPLAPHTHFVLSFDDGPELHFVDPRKFGRIYYFSDSEALDAFLVARLGPEPLDNLTAARLAQLIGSRRRRLKALLLDQSFLAGLGNLYADEILWQARLHPERSASSLTRPELQRLADSIEHVLRAAIERRGTTFSSYLDAAGEPGANQFELQVYGRAGQPCARCGRAIERRLIAQRGTWLCPGCQRPRGSAPRAPSGTL
jgi:formamidopyrimidine-DNA glycosylase